jgi:hypothetical protein
MLGETNLQDSGGRRRENEKVFPLVIPGRAKRGSGIHNPGTDYCAVTPSNAEHEYRGYGFRAHAKMRVPE